MRCLVLLFSIILLSSGCKGVSADAQRENSDTNNQVEAASQISTIAFEASTRGYQETILVTKDSLKVSSSKAKKETNVTLPEDNWIKLTTLVNGLNLNEIEALEAPTSKRYADAALAANVTITTTNKTFTSSEFDKGKPPKELKALVDLLLSYMPN